MNPGRAAERTPSSERVPRPLSHRLARVRPTVRFPLALPIAFALASGLAVALAGCGHRPAAGRLAPHAPIQEDLAGAGEPRHLHGYTLTPLARFHVEARVLSAERYWADREARLAPVDLALGWGPMSDSEVLTDLSITQMGRYYMWSGRELPLEPEQITHNSANMHMIPADESVRRTLLRVHRDQVVRFAGALVRVEGDDGWSWTSSLTRDDSGDGSCEVVLVDSLAIE